ncbi:hypothetical protein PACTADRAFT_48437 [Pachysolen tannophilus NRRL Y-2460]|uniref:Uncharacterized protein n=1 Tax=Pachysolen tannophilus NRRL Y-2460 TaxID=669874 RepID=A0A1E4TXY5_PACTA|nr:hypothetical protein PACTADRAFT_48437 [Pachysolen tannophilus NRRL Y-2460]
MTEQQQEWHEANEQSEQNEQNEWNERREQCLFVPTKQRLSISNNLSFLQSALNNNDNCLISSSPTSTLTTSFGNYGNGAKSGDGFVHESNGIGRGGSNSNAGLDSNSNSNSGIITNRYVFPVEILNQIIEQVYYNNISDIKSITSNLDNFAKNIVPVSHIFKILSQRLLYRYAVFTRPNSFDKFLTNLNSDEQLGLNVKFLDFMEFTSIGLGRTGKMNEEIQMVTNKTILNCLKLTPNLLEFLASESIETDIDVNILNHLFNHLIFLKSLDFCGATNLKFIKAFQDLNILRYSIPNITKISFHDCTNLPSDVFIKLLPKLINLQRLDLSHTMITCKILDNFLPKTCKLTHLSLSRCSKLTTRELLEFFVHNEIIQAGNLKWLNLQVDNSVVSPLNEDQLTYLLKHLNTKNLKYLNLGGFPINSKHLQIMKENFPHLESLGISNAKISVDDLYHFLKETKNHHHHHHQQQHQQQHEREQQNLRQNLKFIDLSGIKSITRWTIDQPLLLDASNSLEAIELGSKIVDELRLVSTLQTPSSIWKLYDNNQLSRRGWLYKSSKEERLQHLKNPQSLSNNFTDNLVFYDIETGQKITKIVKPPKFLKYASKKINCSIGPFDLARENSYYDGRDEENLEEDVFPVEFSERGIYKYYSLNR